MALNEVGICFLFRVNYALFVVTCSWLLVVIKLNSSIVFHMSFSSTAGCVWSICSTLMQGFRSVVVSRTVIVFHHLLLNNLLLT
jgi:hypothetical protein